MPFPKRPNAAIAALAWGASNGTISLSISSTKRLRRGMESSPMRARKTIPASSSETELNLRVAALSMATRNAGSEGSLNVIATRADESITISARFFLAGKSKFVVSQDFVIGPGIQDGQRGDFLLDGFHLLPINRAGFSAQLVLQGADYRFRQSDT